MTLRSLWPKLKHAYLPCDRLTCFCVRASVVFTGQWERYSCGIEYFVVQFQKNSSHNATWIIEFAYWLLIMQLPKFLRCKNTLKIYLYLLTMHKLLLLYYSKRRILHKSEIITLLPIVGIATDYGLDGPGDRIPVGGEIFRNCPDRPWGPPSPLYNGYRVFPGGKCGWSGLLTTLSF
jgi:hypothetical protein